MLVKTYWFLIHCSNGVFQYGKWLLEEFQLIILRLKYYFSVVDELSGFSRQEKT